MGHDCLRQRVSTRLFHTAISACDKCASHLSHLKEEKVMKRAYVQLAGLLAAMLGSVAFAQAPPPAQPSDPSAASSPSQRSAVKSPAEESSATGANASDSATPHQKQVMKKKHKKKAAAPPPSN
jgi:hypothetical protein